MNKIKISIKLSQDSTIFEEKNVFKFYYVQTKTIVNLKYSKKTGLMQRLIG